MSDNELDKLFQDAAEGFKAPEDPSAWKDMASRLDKDLSPAPFWNWKTISIVAFIGLTGVSVVWDSLLSDTPTMVQPPLSTQGIGNERSDSERVSSSAAVLNKNESKNNNSKISDSESNASAIEKDLNPRNGSLLNIRKSDFYQTTTNYNPTSTNQLKSLNQITIGSDDQAIIGDSTQAKILLIANSNSYSPKEILVESISQVEITEAQLSTTDSLGLKTKESSRKSKTSLNFFSLKLSVSPDFSSIEFFTPDKPGMNYGALVGYSFANRWSFFTGAILSRKIYSSTEIEDPYTSSGGYDYPVNKLDGDCRVLDIPLNVYYSFYQGHSLSFSAGVGFSSYLMLEEDYTYHVDNPYGSNVYSNHVANENNEWFKVLNISFIMQKRLSNHFSLEVEPFLKAPLAGVGEGKVSLVSMGASVNLRYDFLKFKQ